MAGPGQKLIPSDLRTPLLNDQQMFAATWSNSLQSNQLHRKHLKSLNRVSCALQGLQTDES